MAELVKTKDIKSGMVLAKPLLNRYNQTLLKAGTHIEKSHIHLLKTWNIMAITVKENNEDEAPELNEEILSIAREKLAARLNWEPRNEMEEDLIEMGVMNYAKTMLGKGSE